MRAWRSGDSAQADNAVASTGLVPTIGSMRPLSLISVWYLICVGPVFLPIVRAGDDAWQSMQPAAPLLLNRSDGYNSDGYVGRSTGAGAARFLGSRSCAATSCHGGSVDAHLYQGTSGKEFLIWLENDPHTGSLATLEKARSQRMIAQLVEHSSVPATDATRQRVLDRCYACHSGGDVLSDNSGKNHFPAHGRDSVSCEACHGPAQEWIREHFQSYWHQLSSDEKAARGMVDTANLMRRAQACVKCHVGSPGRDVDHDLIAAGHPVLKFEFAGYLARLPKHWNGRAERIANSDFELRVWAAGQLAAAEASLQQLAMRATAADHNPAHAAWPEFSEYDCYACHHDLSSGAARQPAPGRAPAQLFTASRWNVMMAQQWASLIEKDDTAFEFLGALAGLRDEMQRDLVPKPDVVGRSAEETLDSLRRWSAGVAATTGLDGRLDSARRFPAASSFAKIPLRSMLESLQLQHDDEVSLDWDTATQMYLAAVAWNIGEMDRHRHGWSNTGFTSMQPRRNNLSASEHARWLVLRDLRRQLMFPAGQQSPPSPWRVDSQGSEQFISQMQNFLRMLDSHEKPNGA